MRVELIPVRGLTATISVHGDLDVTLQQVGVVSVSCYIEGRGNKPFKVTADDGIEFGGAGVLLSLPAAYNVTEICDLAALEREIADLVEARAECAPVSRAVQRRAFALEA